MPTVQGYLAHKKTPPPITLQWACFLGPYRGYSHCRTRVSDSPAVRPSKIEGITELARFVFLKVPLKVHTSESALCP